VVATDISIIDNRWIIEEPERGSQAGKKCCHQNCILDILCSIKELCTDKSEHLGMKVAVMTIHICAAAAIAEHLALIVIALLGSLNTIIIIIVTPILDLKFVLAENRIVYHY